MPSKARKEARSLAKENASAKKIARKTGLSREAARNVVSNWAPKPTVPAPDPTANQPGPFNISQGGAVNNDTPGMSAEDYSSYLYNSGLITLQGNINTELEKLRNTGLSSVASIQAGATVRSAELDSESRKYLADKDYLARTDVEKIRGQANLDLQNIINAGLKDVEGIRQEGGRDIARITGEFGVKQESERQRGQKDIANIGAGSAYRNALIGAFSF